MDLLGPSQIRGVSLHSPTFYIVQSQFLHLRVVKRFDRNKSDATYEALRCQQSTSVLTVYYILNKPERAHMLQDDLGLPALL